MDKVKQSILHLLNEDARYTPEKLAVMLGVDAKIVEENIKSLEDEGYIVKYTAIINTEKVSPDFVDALIEIRVTPQARSGYDAIAEQINRFEEVKAVYLVSGAYDLAVSLESKTIRDVSLFVSDKLSTIEGIIGATTHFIMKKYKESGVSLTGVEHNNRIPLHE